VETLMDEPSNPRRTEKTGVLLVSGFLGSGKTTLLRHLISWKEDMSDTVVIVNEFGDIGIDGSLLRGGASDVIELTSGCICCTLAVDLTILLQSIWERFSPRWIIIEASGVADPTSIISALWQARIGEHIRSLRVITVLDADCWEVRSIMGQLFYRQIETADIILLNKIDLLDREIVKRYLGEIHEILPETQIVPTVHCGIDPESILRGAIGDEPSLHNYETISNQEHGIHASDAGFIAFSFEDDRAMNKASFEQFIEELPGEVFRIKGTVRYEDRTVLINYVGGRAEWSIWTGSPETKLAFVGWDTEPEEILGRLEKCIAPR
jgi:G3E family GTPase